MRPDHASGAWVGRLERIWYDAESPPLWLRPFSSLFGLVVGVRVALYRAGWLPVQRLSRPVIVAGNIAVGGTGKTPLVLWLCHWLTEQGWRPGVIARGYGGKARRWPQRVTAKSDPFQVGDEAVLLARRGVERIAVGPDRVAAGQLLLQDTDCDIVVCDDGLQHYRLARDVEIAVIDGTRGLGNGYLLPAGPLREPAARLKEVDFRVYKGISQEGPNGNFSMGLSGSEAFPVDPGRGKDARALLDFTGKTIHAVAGIGNPRRFFDLLRGFDIDIIEHVFPDHHAFAAGDLDFGNDAVVLMTEKDAVKCVDLDDGSLWCVPVNAQLDTAFEAALREELAELRS